MSILYDVKTKVCPICGCSEIIGESIKTENAYLTNHSLIKSKQISQHCNGSRWETRTFLCGMVIKYCPNFSSEEYDEMDCINNIKRIERTKNRTDMLNQTLDFINNLTQDEDFKNHLLSQLSISKYYV